VHWVVGRVVAQGVRHPRRRTGPKPSGAHQGTPIPA
jgi:hypothetical protein